MAFNRVVLPGWLRNVLRAVRDIVLAVPCYGSGQWCPVCEKSSRRFRNFGNPQRKNAMCVHCGALERHRLVWLYFSRRTDLFDGRPKQTLHVAPERCFEPRLRKLLGSTYTTADICADRAMVEMDVTSIQYPAASFDVIYCSHVLEHVPDDKQALREFHRVLKDSGWAVILVPVTAQETFEDSSVTDPGERLRLFGQPDHVRRYGPDFVQRLCDAGFHVTITRASDFLTEDEVIYMGLASVMDSIYFCTKT